jgi:hypothetical protein
VCRASQCITMPVRAWFWATRHWCYSLSAGTSPACTPASPVTLKVTLRAIHSTWISNVSKSTYHLAFAPHFFPSLGWSGTESTITEATTGLLCQPRMMVDHACGAFGGMFGRGYRSTRRKPVTIPLCSPQIPHNLTRSRTRAAAVGSRRPTAWATTRPGSTLTYFSPRFVSYV